MCGLPIAVNGSSLQIPTIADLRAAATHRIKLQLIEGMRHSPLDGQWKVFMPKTDINKEAAEPVLNEFSDVGYDVALAPERREFDQVEQLVLTVTTYNEVPF